MVVCCLFNRKINKKILTNKIMLKKNVIFTYFRYYGQIRTQKNSPKRMLRGVLYFRFT